MGTETPANNTEIEKRLWDAADELRANSKLKSSEYSVPVLGLIFLRYADHKFAQAEKELKGLSQARLPGGDRSRRWTTRRGRDVHPGSRPLLVAAEPARGREHRQGHQRCHAAIEDENDDLKDVLPKTYNRLDNSVLVTLLKTFNSIPMDIEGDAFGKIYEYFLGKFAMSEGQKGGEFFTPYLAGQADRRGDRALSRPDLRPGLRVGRHVRAERRLRRAPH